MVGATNATFCGMLGVGSGIWDPFWFAVLERRFVVSEAFTLNFTLQQFLPSSPRSPCTVHYQDGYSDYIWDQENDHEVGSCTQCTPVDQFSFITLLPPYAPTLTHHDTPVDIRLFTHHSIKCLVIYLFLGHNHPNT